MALVRIIYNTDTLSVSQMIIPDDDAELQFHVPPEGESALDIPRDTFMGLGAADGIPDKYSVEAYLFEALKK